MMLNSFVIAIARANNHGGKALSLAALVVRELSETFSKLKKKLSK